MDNNFDAKNSQPGVLYQLNNTDHRNYIQSKTAEFLHISFKITFKTRNGQTARHTSHVW